MIDWEKVWEEFSNWYDNDKIIGVEYNQRKPVAKTRCYKKITNKIRQLVEKRIKKEKK